jgi:hypothetical protein
MEVWIDNVGEKVGLMKRKLDEMEMEGYCIDFFKDYGSSMRENINRGGYCLYVFLVFIFMNVIELWVLRTRVRVTQFP